jgi:hypothetical protein
VTTFDRFTEQAKRWVRREQRTFSQPDDDWDMSIGIDFPGEERHYFFRVPSPLANSEEGKDALAHALGMAVHQFKPTKLAIISSTWMVELPAPRPHRGRRPVGGRPGDHACVASQDHSLRRWAAGPGAVGASARGGRAFRPHDRPVAVSAALKSYALR